MTTPDTSAQATAQRLADDLVTDGDEIGLQVAAYLDGELVVDVHAGLADPGSGRPVTGRTLFHGWSAGKGVTATALHVAAERGFVDYDAPIAHYWPAFGARGKEQVTVRQVLTHRAGVPQLPVGLTTLEQLHDWDAVCALVADLEPRWVAGAGTGYHAFTFGWIVGEIIRRACGRSVDEVIRADIALPLGVSDSLFCTVPAEKLDRVATLHAMPASGPAADAVLTHDATPPGPLMVTPELGNDPVFLTACIPAVGTMSARALARTYAAVIGPVDGYSILSPARMRVASAVQTSEVDQVLGVALHKSLGYMNGHVGTGGRTDVFGMNGAGGSVGFADPCRGFTFALMRSRMNGFAPPERDAVEEIAAAVRAELHIPACQAVRVRRNPTRPSSPGTAGRAAGTSGHR